MAAPTRQEFDEAMKRNQQRVEDHYRRWLELPEVKLLISMVPAPPAPELLPALLRSAFNAGEAIGSLGVAAVLSDLINKSVD